MLTQTPKETARQAFEALLPLLGPLRSLKGLGPKGEEKLRKVLGAGLDEPRVIDILWHLPTGHLHRRFASSIADLEPGRVGTVIATPVQASFPPRGRKAPCRIVCEDESGALDLIFFHGDRAGIERALPLLEPRLISGRVDRHNGKLQITHPDHISKPEQLEKLRPYEPVYLLTLGLTQKYMHAIMAEAVGRLPDLPDWLDAGFLAKQDWPSFTQSLRLLHAPRDGTDIALWPKARERLAFDEILSSQIAIALVRQRYRTLSGRSLFGDGRFAMRMRSALPYVLTSCQETALAEIKADMLAPRRMLRLLQGDVGSGKTVVAALAIANAVEAGAQAALMAPTDVLGRQHLETLAPLFHDAGVTMAYLSGREQGKARTAILTKLAEGETRVLVGTHAIFQPDVQFQDLGLAIVDEQHRFGVAQRLALQQKAQNGDADILVMTATPIPRTLLLSQHGDLDVSRLLEKPAGRKPVTTRAVSVERLDDVIEGLKRALSEGAQAYWVCPAVDTDTAREMAAAEARAAHLRQIFDERVGLIHGKMRGAEKDAAIAAFSARETSILVATTVIEVGVNVPNATVMIIENAEMFGLAQLHQLRGRVGRGAAQSSCMLLYKNPLSATAKARLETMRQCDDGFVIAEEDLALRGGGDLLGARQSGDPGFRLAVWPAASAWIETAADCATYYLGKDATLTSTQGQALRLLLNIFNRTDAVRLLQAG